MKHILLMVFLLSICSGVRAQQAYRQLSTFKGDTIAYFRYNFDQNKQRYIGQPLLKLLEDYEAGYGFTNALPRDKNVVTSATISPWWGKRYDAVGLVITFRQPLSFEINPTIREADWDTNWMEDDFQLVAMKMKDGIVKDIEVQVYSEGPVPPAGIESSLFDIYKMILSRQERRDAANDYLKVNIHVDPKTGKVTGADVEFDEDFDKSHPYNGFKAVPKEKWPSFDHYIKNAGFVFRIPEGMDQPTYTWTYKESGDARRPQYFALRGTPIKTDNAVDGFSRTFKCPSSPIYLNNGLYREYTLRSSAKKFEIKFIYGSYNLAELAKVRPVIGRDTENGSSGSFTGSVPGHPMWAVAEIYNVNDFMSNLKSVEDAEKWVEYIKTKTFYIIDDSPDERYTGNRDPYSYGISKIHVNRLP